MPFIGRIRKLGDRRFPLVAAHPSRPRVKALTASASVTIAQLMNT